MASGDFTVPLGHSNFGISNLNFCIGRDYLQPVDIPQFNNTHIFGLECWVENSSTHNNLYAILNGILSYNPLDNKLILSPTDSTRMNEIRGMLEPIPEQIFYNYPKSGDVNQAINDILTTEYNDTSSNHPILKSMHRVSDQTLRDYLTNEDHNGNLVAAIADLANSFSSGTISLAVQAGDLIGKAGDPPAGLSLPPSCFPFPPASGTKYLLLEILDYAGFHMDPAYYLWRFLRDEHVSSNPKMQFISIAPKRADNTFDHPLLDGLNIDLDIERKPRAIINTILPGQSTAQDVLLFPLERLGNWHGIKLGTRSGNREVSLIEVKLTNDNNLNLEVRRKPNENSQDYQLCGESFSSSLDICPVPSTIYFNTIQSIWNDWGNDINDICRILQWPAELVVATIAKETSNGERKIRLESINWRHENAMRNGGVPQSLIDSYNYFIENNNLIITVPNPWDDNARLNNSINFTYGDLLQLVDYIDDRVSPGLMQSLIDKVYRGVLNWLQVMYPDVVTTFSLNNAIPQNIGDQLKWMLTGRQAILTGVAWQKYSYCYFSSRIDPYLVAATYNAGSLVQARNGVNPFGIHYNGMDYPIDFSRYYNRIQNRFINGFDGNNKFYKSK